LISKKAIIKNKKSFFIWIGLLLFTFLTIINPFSLAIKTNVVLASALLMVFWWITDALPMAMVALIPIILFPLFGISHIKNVTASYSDSILFLFMGGFLIGIAIEKWNLHKRIALTIIKKTGFNGNKIVLGFIISSGFLSLWLSNSATTMMMFPIAMSVIRVIEKNTYSEMDKKNFSISLLLATAYGSNFALGTIIGTPPNIAYVNYVSDRYNYTIGFTNWMIVFIPLTIVLLGILYVVLTKWLYPNKIKEQPSEMNFIVVELQRLGSFSVAEKRLLIIFLATVSCWILKDFINSIESLFKLDDTIIALTGAIALFITPSGDDKNNANRFLLDWEDTKKMAWEILILFGGGIALARALEDVGLIQQLGDMLASFSTHRVFWMIGLITLIAVFLSELISNVAQVIVMAPIVSSIASTLHMDPLLLGIPMTLGASCASMLPMGTPPNAIVYGSGYVKIKDMIRAGFILNILCVITITLFCYFFQPFIIHSK